MPRTLDVHVSTACKSVRGFSFPLVYIGSYTLVVVRQRLRS